MKNGRFLLTSSVVVIVIFVFCARAQEGTSWQLRCGQLPCTETNVGINYYFASAFFTDSNKGWFVGTNGEFFDQKRAVRGSTKDGGKTWKIQSSDVISQYLDITFVSATKGFIIGGDVRTTGRFTPFLLETSNGGKDWTTRRIDDCPTGIFETLRFISPEIGLIGGKVETSGDKEEALILRTTDGGKRWTKALIGEKEILSGQSIRSIAFDPSGEFGVAISAESLVLVTDDRGARWKRSQADIGSEVLGGVFVRSTTEAWVTTGRGEVYRTTDKGATWVRMAVCAKKGGSDSNPPWFSGVLFDGSMGWIGGSDGLICATTDGGKTWRRQKSPNVFFISRFEKFNDSLVAVGGSGLLVKHLGKKRVGR